MHRQNHIAGVVCDNVVRVSCDAVKELVEILHCVLCGGGLMRGESPKRGEHREIDGACIVKENSYDFLDNFFVGLGDEGRVVVVLCVLHLLPVHGLGVEVKLILWPLGGGVVEAGESGLGVSQHGGVDCAFDVVPIEVDAQVFGACPVMRDGVVLG